MTIRITLVYYGKFAERTGRKEDVLEVNELAGRAYETVAKYLREQYGIIPPFNMMLNGKHIISAVKGGVRLNTGDFIKLLPFYSGG